MVNYRVIFELMIVNILRVLLIRKMMELFLPAEEDERKKIRIGYVCYYLLVTILFRIFNISALYGICSYLGIAGLTFFYRGTWKKRIWVSLAVFATDLSCSLAVYFAFSYQLIVSVQAVQTLLLLICVTIISRISDTAADREIAFDKGQTGILIAVPVAGILILSVLLYGGYQGMAATLICVSTLIINLSIFYLYHMMAENYRNLRENDIYRQQTYAYRNQLDVIMESQGRIRALRHDMKNHMAVLQNLLRKKGADEDEEIRQYFEGMRQSVEQIDSRVHTGNAVSDAVVGSKFRYAAKKVKGIRLDASKFMLTDAVTIKAYDMGIILNNGLDNAVEACMQMREKQPDAEAHITIRSFKAKNMYFIEIENSFDGSALSRGDSGLPISTKKDKEVHGIGLKNIRKCAVKYGGDLDCIVEGNKFTLSVMVKS